jgi:8-oxo-dGTP pyrophosphatase MutT (NUDIX family)
MDGELPPHPRAPVGLSKGRRNIREPGSNMHAMREFMEETGICLAVHRFPFQLLRGVLRQQRRDVSTQVPCPYRWTR